MSDTTKEQLRKFRDSLSDESKIEFDRDSRLYAEEFDTEVGIQLTKSTAKAISRANGIEIAPDYSENLLKAQC